MQRVASVKSVLQEKKEGQSILRSLLSLYVRELLMKLSFITDDSRRSPECVERVWTEEEDGAWAVGKAPVQLLTALLQHVQDDDVAQAELTARASTSCLLFCSLA